MRRLFSFATEPSLLRLTRNTHLVDISFAPGGSGSRTHTASGDPTIKTAGWDLTSAFLHATMDKTVYMKQPAGYVDPLNPLHSCRLLKALYGTPQASRLFYLTIKTALAKLGFHATGADECLFIKRQGTSFMKLLIHVDDFAITYNDRAMYDEVFAAMQTQFKMTDFGLQSVRI